MRRDRRVGGHRPEHTRLGPQHAHVGQAVTAQCDRQGHVQQDLARIVYRPRASPWRERCRYRLVQPGLADGLDQQHAPGLGHHGPTTALNADTRVGPDTLTHLESASDRGGNRDLDNPHSRWSEALSAFLTTRRTACFMKTRG